MRDHLEKLLVARGCTVQQSRDAYSSLLVRCGCGRHALAAAACGDKSDDAVKLFGAALSWYRSTGRSGPLTFVLAKDAAGRWQHALHAIQMILPPALPVELRLDLEPAPALSDVDLSSSDWVDDMLNVKKRTLPPLGFGLQAQAAIGTFAWYRSVTGREWSGRLDGLQVCTLSSDGTKVTFNVGNPGAKDRESRARLEFLKLVAPDVEPLGTPDGEGQLVLGPADEARAVSVLRRLNDADLAQYGSAEHRLESRILRGVINLMSERGPLQIVPLGHPYQFPARWWPGGKPKYVDVMAQQGAVPWVVELKIGSSQGEYYRDGIVQTALYRQYILRSPGLDAWFERHQLNRRECRAALVIPPLQGPNAAHLRDDHRALGNLLGVELIEERAAA